MIYRRTVAEIDLDAIDFNIKSIRKRVPMGTKILGTIKADGYGHGAVEVAEVLRQNGVEMFSVALLDEAVYLRKNGITESILLLGFTPAHCAEEIVKYDIIQTISSYREATIVSAAAVKLGKIAKIHIKIDTGMGRIGFFPCDESVEEIVKICQLDGIEIDGMFTHFAISDCTDKTFTSVQKGKFFYIIDELRKRGISIPHKHCANSAGIMDFDDLFLDMVRPGIILYGMYPSDEVIKENLPLKPAMCLKTQVSFIKDVDEKTSIGYGRTYFAKGKRKIATLPVGYADGFCRLLSNKGFVIIHGQKAPIVGRICMDQCMVDITEIDGVNIEDEVVLMGKMGNEEISADDIAKLIGTINYEVVCMVDKRVPRVYIKNGNVVKVVNHLLGENY
ncbi:MAG TPA: alanine racemase [Lachnospiraceae bacterium]|nr:alanine racemase [Lachnospiraceae bacterium]